jgi:metal-responsive CopG/Arc/MetJ family transcriptional regulator
MFFQMAKRKQVLVQLSDELVERLDKVAAGEETSRSAVVREAVTRYVIDKENEEKERRWIEGYERYPVTDEERAWGEFALRQMIADAGEGDW